jgi:NAD(P)-dependent dehydrogenase (short-subunit alcohol dehydrogenase family)
MSNQVVLIIGALTGIGRAAAVAFAKKGAKVVVPGRRDEAGKALVKELRSFGSEAEFTAWLLRSPRAPIAMAARCF